VDFFAIKLPSARVALGIARELTEFGCKRFKIGFAGQSLKILAHQLIDTLAHGFRAAPRLLDDFVINGQG